MSRLLDSFTSEIPIFAMLHHKGDDTVDVQARARREIDVLWASGVDAVIVENYFGGVDDVIATWLKWKRQREIDPMRLRPHPYEFCLYFDA